MRKRNKRTKEKKFTAKEISQAEDRALKMSAQYFGKELLRYFDVKGKIREVFATELNYVEPKRLFQDFNYLMEDDSCCHFEFESDRVGKDDLRRFRAYEAVTSYTYQKPVITHVVCSENVKEPISSLKEGINEYRVNMIRFKDGNADEVFRQMDEKNSEEVTKEELLRVVLTPLMGGEMIMKERIVKGFQILKKEYSAVPDEDLKRMQAVLYLFALKFLGRKEVEETEELHMTYFAAMMQEEGRLKVMLSQIMKKLQRGKALEIIALEVEESVEKIRPIYNVITENSGKTEEELFSICRSVWTA